MIDSHQASEALADITATAHRVRQSTIYHLASLMLIMWGVLVFAGYLASYLAPRYAGYGWLAVYIGGTAGSILISPINRARTGIRTFDLRFLVAFLLFIAFGIFASGWLGHFTARQMGTFWPIYFMTAYTIAGLWVGRMFAVVGLGIIALTLIGYFFLAGAFDLWMAFVDGGGLLLAGLWMRRS
jgi:hypothetical protein